MIRKIYKFNFWFLYINLFSAFLFSEDVFVVHGVILDELTKRPIQNVNIYNQKNDIGTYTNSSGEFDLYIKNVSKLNLLITHIGYENYTLELNQSVNGKVLTVFIKPLFLDSESVVVTGNSSPKRLVDSPILTEVVYSDQLLSIGASNIFESLQTILPNVSFSPDAHGTNIKINSFDTQYIVILIDGERLSGNTSGNIDLNRLNMNDIDRIEIVKGSTSILYGSNAIGSVVNIITKGYNDKGYKSKLGYRFSNFNTSNIWSLFKFNFGKFYSNTNYIEKKSDGYDLSPETPKTWDLRKFNDKSITQKFRYEISNQNLIDFKFNYYEFEFYQPPEMIADRPHRKRYVANNYVLNWSNNFYSQKINLSINYDQYRKYHILDEDYNTDEDNRRFPWTVDEYRSIKIIDVFSKGIQTFSLGYEFIRDTGKSHDVTVDASEYFIDTNGNGVWDDAEEWEDLDGDGHWDDGSEIELGGQCSDFDGDGNCDTEEEEFNDNNGNGICDDTAEYLIDDNENGIWDNSYDKLLLGSEFGTDEYLFFDIHNIFLQDEIKLSNNKFLTVGFRYINHSSFGNAFTPSISFISKNIPFLHRFNLSKGYRTPSLKELYYNWDHYGMWEIRGNSNLLPETSYFFSYSLEYLKQDLNFSTNFIFNKITNMIHEDYSIIDGQSYYDFNQYGSVFSNSIDINLKYKFSSISLDMSYSYTDMFDLESNKSVNGISLHSFNSHISKRMEKFNFNINLFYRYVGDKIVESRDQNTFEFIDSPISDYGIWKLSISKNNLFKIINFSFGIDNLFDYINKNDPSSINPGRTYYMNIEIG